MEPTTLAQKVTIDTVEPLKTEVTMAFKHGRLKVPVWRVGRR